MCDLLNLSLLRWSVCSNYRLQFPLKRSFFCSFLLCPLSHPFFSFACPPQKTKQQHPHNPHVYSSVCTAQHHFTPWLWFSHVLMYLVSSWLKSYHLHLERQPDSLLLRQMMISWGYSNEWNTKILNKCLWILNQ